MKDFMKDVFDGNKKRQDIVNKAIEMGIIPTGEMSMGEEIFIVPDFCMVSGSTEAQTFEDEIGKSENFIENYIFEQMNILAELPGDEIIVMSTNKDEKDGMMILSVLNPRNKKNFEIRIKTKFDEKDRYLIVGILTNAIKLNEVKVMTKMFAGYSVVEEIVNEESFKREMKKNGGKS